VTTGRERRAGWRRAFGGVAAIPFLFLFLFLFLLGAVSCAPTARFIEAGPGPETAGLAVLDCRFSFEFKNEESLERNLLNTNESVERLGIPQRAQNATVRNADQTAPPPILARPTRGLLLLGPLPPGNYLLEQVGLDREYLGGGMRAYEIVREPVRFRPGTAGTERLLFVVEPGTVIYIGRMNAKGVLDDAAALAAQGNVAPAPAGMFRRTVANDDRVWSVTWDRDIENEIAAWELMMVSLKGTAWSEPITRRLERLKGNGS
jgi:hypothetical protein